MKYNDAKKMFDDYAKTFDFENNKVDYKYDHSYRVADIALSIAKSLNLNDEDCELAHINSIKEVFSI